MVEAVYIRYRDHVLFKNCISKAVKSAVREAVGWIVNQDETAIWLVCDRSCFDKPLPGKESVESGLVICALTFWS
jgi:hypothetical protein